MRRAPRIVADQRDTLVSLAARLETCTLVVDVEPLLAMWGAPIGEVIAGAIALAHAMAAEVSSLRCLVFATNARMSLPKTLELAHLRITFVSAAGKPWRIGYLANSPRPIAVIGDQVVTDGLLAFRLGATFLHWQSHDNMPFWPRVQTIIGSLIMDAFFSLQGIQKTWINDG